MRRNYVHITYQEISLRKLISGTTSTSLLAAMAAGGAHAKDSVQIALVHLMFNIIGIGLFYPIPFMRWPIALAQVTY